MPSGENNFYIDDDEMGAYYTKFVGEELIQFTRKMFNLSTQREETYIGGFSMGGYGAIRTGLLYPETFYKVLSFSSALIAKDIAGISTDYTDLMADYNYYHRVFGDLNSILDSDKNPEVLVETLSKTDRIIPEIFMVCGTEDFLLNQNRDFNEYLNSKDIAHKYQESKGNHDWMFVNQYLEEAVKWAIG